MPEKPIWDIQILLDYIATGRPNKSLTLRQLGGRLACLIRLATVHRSCNLCCLDIRSMSWTNNRTSVHFILNAPSKTVNAQTEPSRAKKLQTLSLEQIPLHPEELKQRNLCPVRALKCYLKKTKPIRQTNALFIESNEFTAVATSTIGKWIKNTMEEAGVDISIYGPHSVRSASVSKAYGAGASVAHILRKAGWKSKTTFIKHYLKNVAHQKPSAQAAASYVGLPNLQKPKDVLLKRHKKFYHQNLKDLRRQRKFPRFWTDSDSDISIIDKNRRKLQNSNNNTSTSCSEDTMITAVPKVVKKHCSEGGVVVLLPKLVSPTVQGQFRAIKPKPNKPPHPCSPLPPTRECPPSNRRKIKRSKLPPGCSSFKLKPWGEEVKKSRLPPGCSSFKLEPCETAIPLQTPVVHKPVIQSNICLSTDSLLMPPPPSPSVIPPPSPSMPPPPSPNIQSDILDVDGGDFSITSQTLDTDTGDTLVQIDMDDIKLSDLTVFDEDIQKFLTASDNLLQDIPLGNCTISAPPTVNDKEYVFIDETPDIILSENDSKPISDTEIQAEDNGIPPGRFVLIRPKNETTDIPIQAPMFLNYLTPLVVPKADFKGDN